ncbi:hypothetical protein BVC80_9055g38 [Macleaya cordata]|uniref:SHSP domain-containing protein n=1 Tax=Macleaya cordata TaxID=56857 RepID=A0A200R9J4_MACCD|nr:hypothetical protein BVC80_9055g38 [Macleaya cordata]
MVRLRSFLISMDPAVISSLVLPEDAITDDISARWHDDVLTVTVKNFMPPAKSSNTKVVKIKLVE